MYLMKYERTKYLHETLYQNGSLYRRQRVSIKARSKYLTDNEPFNSTCKDTKQS